MSIQTPQSEPDSAVNIRPWSVRATVRGGAVTKGDVLMLDILASDAAVTTADGKPTGIFGSFVTPTAAMVLGQTMTMGGVALEDASDDARCNLQIVGDVNAFVIGASGSMAIGTDLIVTTAKNLDIISATGEVFCGVGLEAVTTPTTRTLGRVFFNGLAFWFGAKSA